MQTPTPSINLVVNMEQGNRIEAAVAYETKVLFFLMATAFCVLIQ